MPSITDRVAEQRWPKVAVDSGDMTERGTRLKRAREHRNMSQLDVANLTGVGLRTIGRAEAGQRISESNFAALERFFGLGDEAELPPADNEPREVERPASLEDYSLLELLAEAVRRVAHTEAQTGSGERTQHDLPVRVKWPSAAAPSARRGQQDQRGRDIRGVQ